MKKKYNEIQAEEARTWLLANPLERHEKIQRETARYPFMAKQMGLSFIDTSPMVVVDIGGGPVGLSSVIPYKSRIVIDPLTDEYRKYFPCNNHVTDSGEHLSIDSGVVDLVIITNALDHCENPEAVVAEIDRILKPGGYFAHYHAINNAITHEHPAHEHNLNPLWLHELIDDHFETVWELQYPEVRYGWRLYNKKVGQPAFCGLYRKVVGY